MNEYRMKDIVNVREKMGFIGRTKRTIWMGSPSLHPTYSNFLHSSDSHWMDTSLHTDIDRKT